jgi:hypothetical protein
MAEQGTLQLSDLMTQSRQRADQIPQNYVPTLTGTDFFVTESELISYINQSYFELYDLLVQKYGDDYFVAPPLSFTTDGQNYLYPLPDGTIYNGAPAFYKVLGFDLNLAPQLPLSTSESFITIPPFMFAERNRCSVPNMQAFYGLTNLRYRLQGNNVWFTPLPAFGQVIQMWYIPRMTQLVNLTDTVDGVSGWTEYIIVDAAIKMMQKEESDVSVLMAQKQALILRIEAAAANRDAGNPQVVSDSQSQNWFGSDSGWGWGNGSGGFL